MVGYDIVQYLLPQLWHITPIFTTFTTKKPFSTLRCSGVMGLPLKRGLGPTLTFLEACWPLCSSLVHIPLSIFRCNVTSGRKRQGKKVSCSFWFLSLLSGLWKTIRLCASALIAYQRTGRTNHILNQRLRAPAPSEPALPWIM